jgi:hypothetical protein
LVDEGENIEECEEQVKGKHVTNQDVRERP